MAIVETSSADAAACRSCAAPLTGQPAFCPACGKVQAPGPADYFSLFQLPRRLEIDLPALEAMFYRYSRKLHPDLHARATEEEQQWSTAQASLLNNAYRCLKDPVERTKYLLRLEGAPLEEDQAADGGRVNPSKAPADLLEEVFELNLQLEELRANRKLGEDDPFLRRDLEQSKTHFVAQLEAVDRELRSLWSAWDEAEERGDEAGKTGAKRDLAALLHRRTYLGNLVRDVNETLGDL
jgi:molecular chaperone HscB